MNEYREPLMMDDHGLYITVAQMHFFLNRPKGKMKFKTADNEFLSYYKNCCLYNLVYDMMEENPSCAKMFWDSDSESVSLSFHVKGNVAMALAQVSHIFKSDEEEDEDEDTYGIFS